MTARKPEFDTDTTETDPTQVSDAKDPRPENPEDQYIVHRQHYVDENGVQQNKEIRVLHSEWAAYEKEHGL